MASAVSNPTESELLWSRIGTACLAIYSFYLGLSYGKCSAGTVNQAFCCSFPVLAIISALLLLLPLLLSPSKHRLLMLPAILINMYLAAELIADQIAFAIGELAGSSALSVWPYEFIVFCFLAFGGHCLLIGCAIFYYNALWSAGLTRTSVDVAAEDADRNVNPPELLGNEEHGHQ